MTTEVCSAADLALDMDSAPASFANTTANTTPLAVSLVESVARAVSGISVIGEARNALEAAGCVATIAANRITVDDAVEAQFIPAKVGAYGQIHARWIVSSIAGMHPVWIVGAEQAGASDC